MIVTSNLERALAELQRNLALVDSPLARRQPDLVPTFRAAAIQSFEFTNELAIRALERAIEDRHGLARVDEADFRTRIRMGLEAGLLTSFEAWIGFRAMRNATSHTYNEAKALEVCAGLPSFIAATEGLLTKLGVSDAAP